jgi:dolichol-phosphate mannosyltransferase
MRKMLHFAVDGITSFSTLPLRLATWLGVLAALVAMGLGVWAFYVKLRGVNAVPGWATIMILVALGSSVQLCVIGVLGAYVGRIYEEVQRRPLYTVARQLNLPAHEQDEGSASSGSEAPRGRPGRGPIG